MGMSALNDILEKQHDRIGQYLHTSRKQWPRLVGLARRLAQPPSGESTESAWTFLAACGYAMAGDTGVRDLSGLLTGSQQTTPDHPRIWLEPMAISPREREGATRIDLALGTIARRTGTENGIELAPGACSWICFCEMKWLSDISPKVTYDLHRNQLQRVIENALCFQRSGQYAERVHVTLVTPSVFRSAPVKYLLYQRKFEEYNKDPPSIGRDLEASVLRKRSRTDWFYPSDLPQRIEKLRLRWVTYDKLFQNLPHSPVTTELKGLWNQYGE
jgi:hypothetical protein